jgi:RHS repeat-associated protein
MNNLKTILRSVSAVVLCLLCVRGQAQTTTLPAISPLTTTPIGTIMGSGSVSLSGAATYGVSIAMPPGTNGMIPSVGLSYTSQGGNGIMGIGWGVAAVSSISRGSKSFLLDNAIGAPNLTATDVLLLDGNRLIATENPGGSDFYLTKSESFSRILPQTPLVNGAPTWFKVEAKDGTVYEYGRTSDSRFMSEDGTKIIAWYLNKTYDTYGNYIEYKYNTNATTSREVVLDEIWYTGFQNNATNVVITAPYNRVKMVYTTRSDANTGYIAGNAVKMTSLLSAVQIYVEKAASSTTPDKKWEFGYAYTDAQNKLTSIKESTLKADNTTYEAYNNTLFEYGAVASTYSTNTVNTNIRSVENIEPIVCDLNKDGYADLLVAEYEDVVVDLNYMEPIVYNTNDECRAANTFVNNANNKCDTYASKIYDLSNCLPYDAGLAGVFMNYTNTNRKVPYSVRTLKALALKLNNGNGTYQTLPTVSIPTQQKQEIRYGIFRRDVLAAIKADCNANIVEVNMYGTPAGQSWYGNTIFDPPFTYRRTYYTRRGKVANYIPPLTLATPQSSSYGQELKYIAMGNGIPDPWNPNPTPGCFLDDRTALSSSSHIKNDFYFSETVNIPFRYNVMLEDNNGDGVQEVVIRQYQISDNWQNQSKVQTLTLNTDNTWSVTGSLTNQPPRIIFDSVEDIWSPVSNTSGPIPTALSPAVTPLIGDWSGANMNYLALSTVPKPYVVDVEGDGRDEVLDLKNKKFEKYGGSSFYNMTNIDVTTLPTQGATEAVQTADFNGDGTTDLLLHDILFPNTFKIYYSTGTKYTSPTTITTGITIQNTGLATFNSLIGDFDGNGLADALMYEVYNPAPTPCSGLIGGCNENPIHIFYNNGNGFTKKTIVLSNVNLLQVPKVGDFNGDGISDLLVIDISNDPLLNKVIDFTQGKGRNPLLLQSIRNGLGQVSAFQYKPMTAKDGFYTKGTPTVATPDNSPTTNENNATRTLNSIQFPMYLVSKVESMSLATSPSSTFSAVTYKYENAVLQRTGGGLLGFQKVIAEDATSNRKSVSEFEILCRNTSQLSAVAGSALYTSPTYFYTNALKKQSVYAIAAAAPLTANQLLSETTNTNEVIDRGNTRIWQRSLKSETKDFITGNRVVSTITTDTYGNTLTQKKELFEQGNTSTTPIERSTTTNTYPVSTTANGYFHGSWVPADPLTSVTTSEYRDGITGTNAQTTTTTRTYHTVSGALLTETVNSGGLNDWIKTTFTYPTTNNRGQVLSTAVTANNIAARTTTLEYDTKVRFVTKTYSPEYKTIDALTGLPNPTLIRDIVTKTYEPRYGNVLTETAADKRVVTYQYDPWGRILKTIMPPTAATATPTVQTSHAITKTYQWCFNPATYFFKRRYSVTTAAPGTPTTVVHYDLLGRSFVHSEVDGFQIGTNLDGQVATNIDARGRTTNTHAPNGATTTTTFDDLNRPVTVNVNYTDITNYSYAFTNTGGLVTTVSRPVMGTVSVTTTDAAGKVLSTTENGINTMTYQYDKRGLLKTTKLEGTIINEKDYDARGLVLANKDPMGVGTINYVYNSIGQVTLETHGDQHTRTYTYDDLGRLHTTIIAQPGKTPMKLFSQYNYTNSTTWANNNTGKIDKVFFDKGNGNTHTTTNTYDQFGRVQETTEIIADNATPAQTFVTKYEYDVYNNVILQIYPSLLAVRRNYTSKGYLQTVTNDAGTLAYFSAANITPNGYTEYEINKSTSGSQGAGLNTMAVSKYMTADGGVYVGKAVHKLAGGQIDYYNPIYYSHINWNESYTKIENRITDARSTVVGAPAFPVGTRKGEVFTYDNFDRLTNIKAVGINYLGGGFVGSGDPSTFVFGTTGTDSPITFANNGNISNKYDVGNIAYSNTKIYSATSTQNAQGIISVSPQNTTYTAYKQPSLIQETVGTSVWKMNIDYASDFQRCKSVLTQTVGTTTTTRNTRFYLGDYEIDIDNTSGTPINRQIHYIQGGDGVCAVIVRTNSGADEIYYPFTDHLGSIVAFADVTTKIVYERSFDAWGRRRNPFNFDYATPDAGIPTNSPLKWWYRGYTSHEELPIFALVNMNGRLYDPALGRMLSPDGILHPGSQGVNRYTYAFGNPIKYNDPDGHDPIHGTAMLVGGLVGGFMNWATHGASLDMKGAGYFGSGFAGGALAGATLNPYAAGAIYGGVTGTLNSAIEGASLGDALIQGGKEAIIGAAGGGVAGVMGKGIGKMSVAFKQRAVPFAIKYATYAKDIIKYNFNRRFGAGGDLALTRYLNSGPMHLGSGPITESYLSRIYGSAANVFASKRAELARLFGIKPDLGYNANRLLITTQYDEALVYRAGLIPDTEAGWLTVVVHGMNDASSFARRIGSDFNNPAHWEPIPYESVLSSIKNSAQFTGQNIELWSCNGARLMDGGAPRLAQDLGVRVKSATELIHLNSNLTHYIQSSPDLFGNIRIGQWQYFGQ